ncbi:hypothetical protein [Nocardia shimofusensis]|uniref:hypothetical protein n=1 Tax=Nocardia shimofusensis TaxID=228596 RepID=UPI000AAA7895|nr:hypothetical protein [Nocardia shimofusensis]
MTAMWFGLAAISLVGAVVLLYFDRVQRQRSGHARQVWAKAQGYTYVSVEPALTSTWRRGALAKLGYLSAVDVVSGIRKGEKFVLFDLEDAATLVAVRRQIGSDIDVDMRLKTASPPKDADLELLGAIGDRVVFATNPEIARHAVDQRMVAFIETLPDTVQMLWSEGNWTLGMLNVGTVARDWETAIDAVLRLSGLLHVLPPVSEAREPERGRLRPPADRDPGSDDSDDDPDGPARDRDHDGHDDHDDDPADDSDIDAPDADDEIAAARAARADAEGARRPSLAVVPDRARDERAREDGARAERDRDRGPRDDAESGSDERPRPASGPAGERPGGPFHPGFRPYQGPVPK